MKVRPSGPHLHRSRLLKPPWRLDRVNPAQADLHAVPDVDRADQQREVGDLGLVEVRLEQLVVLIRRAGVRRPW